MKIGLIGYGKMGKTIERLAEKNGDEIVLRIGSGNADQLTTENLRRCDAVIEFTRPEAAFENILACLDAGVPVVSGTTGWLGKLPEAKKICEQKKGAFIYASNFSVGVNLFFAINRYVASLMNGHHEYHPSIEEIHHTQKLDAPSGTAITLAEDLIEKVKNLKTWKLDGEGEGILQVKAKRLPEVPGTHIVSWNSEIDSIELKHTAHSREGFAGGALLAAKWLVGKQGFFTMQDVLGIK
ncbi:MAG: 4-hydroxy-tetrahydrodipicolinate reductase [Saprospirales bacterium]|nr:4-hydroxy-tetrahydrodipicolinate reductase [Saprospirales bacterium]